MGWGFGTSTLNPTQNHLTCKKKLSEPVEALKPKGKDPKMPMQTRGPQAWRKHAEDILWPVFLRRHPGAWGRVDCRVLRCWLQVHRSMLRSPRHVMLREQQQLADEAHTKCHYQGGTQPLTSHFSSPQAFNCVGTQNPICLNATRAVKRFPVAVCVCV